MPKKTKSFMNIHFRIVFFLFRWCAKVQLKAMPPHTYSMTQRPKRAHLRAFQIWYFTDPHRTPIPP